MICYFLVPRKMKNLVLFLGSLVFYAWGEPIYIFLMLFSTISDYVWGRLIEEYRGKDHSRIFLLCSIGINLFILGFFKYADFLLQTVNTVFGTSIPLLKLPLPIGISFYTFQTMSYVIDVYRGDTKAQRNILQFGVYVTMFPQLIAGPPVGTAVCLGGEEAHHLVLVQVHVADIIVVVLIVLIEHTALTLGHWMSSLLPSSATSRVDRKEVRR